MNHTSDSRNASHRWTVAWLAGHRLYVAALSGSLALMLAAARCDAQIKKLAPEYPKVGKLNGRMPPYLVGGLLFVVIVLLAFRSARRSKQS